LISDVSPLNAVELTSFAASRRSCFDPKARKGKGSSTSGVLSSAACSSGIECLITPLPKACTKGKQHLDVRDPARRVDPERSGLA
jgi:hypothetical protein